MNESFDEPIEIRTLERVDAGALAPTEIVALGEGVRAVTRLIEEVGRTLEAQNQRSLRLMERLEQVAKALEAGAEANDRELEALDSVGEAISRQQAPLEATSAKLEALPDLVQAVHEGSRATRDLWLEATRALTGRFAISAAQAEERVRENERRRARRLVLATALSIMTAGGIGVGAVFGARAALRDAIARVVGADRPVVAEEGDAQFHVIRVRTTEPEPSTIVAPAAPVPSGTVHAVTLAPESDGPKIHGSGSIVSEDVPEAAQKDLVPSLVQPMN